MILAKRPRSDVDSCCLADQSNSLYTSPFKMAIVFLSTIKWKTVVALFVLKNGFKDKEKTKIENERLVTTTAKIRWKDELIVFRLDCNIQMRQWRTKERKRQRPGLDWGESANAVPNSHKLCSRVSHIWGNRRLQRHLSAMVESRPEGTALLITVSFEPGKYAYWGSFLCLIKIIASKTINHALSKMNNPKWNLVRKKKVLYSNSLQSDST